MINVIVVDLFLMEYPIYLKLDDVHVELLIVDSQKLKEKVLYEYPDLNVVVSDDVTIWSNSYVSIKDIRKYSDIQLKIYRHSIRHVNKYLYDAKIESMYYSSLAFWLYHLKDNVDLFLQFGFMEHGEFTDSIPMAVAKSRGIQILYTDLICIGKNNEHLYAVKNGCTNQYINIKNISHNFIPININKIMFDNCKVTAEINDNFGDSRDIFSELNYCLLMLNNRILKYFSIIVIIVYIKYLRLLRNIFKLQHNKYKNDLLKIKKYIDILFGNNRLSIIAYIYGKLFHQTDFSIRGIRHHISLSEYKKFKSYLHSLIHYYNKNAVKFIPENVSSIFYALHFEPEASIINRTIYNSQLYNIKMISSALPKGWTLYIKEHPDMFKVSMTCGSYYMNTMSFYRNKQYYDDLLALPNVKLVNMNLKSSDILSMPQIKAVASINGTIILEGIKNNKPVIYFDQSSVPYNDINELFAINCYDDLKSAIGIIESGFEPCYNNYSEILSNYLIYSDTISNIGISSDILSEIINNTINKR